MTTEAIAAVRQQATALRGQATALLVGVDALLAALPTPEPPAEPQRAPRYLGDDEEGGE